MDLGELTGVARDVAGAYAGKNLTEGRGAWTTRDYMAGFVGDVGELSKLLMAHEGLRPSVGVDGLLEHELSDCLWSVLILADRLQVDLEKVFIGEMQGLLQKIQGTDPAGGLQARQELGPDLVEYAQ